MQEFREAAAADFDQIRAIEREASVAFRTIGMTRIAEDEPPSHEQLQSYCRAGQAWVAVDSDDQPIAYLLSVGVDDALYIDQVSVTPAWSRQGLGAALIDFVAARAPDVVAWVTLTTFRDVPWNARYYERLGFVETDPATLTVEVKARIDRENAQIPGTAPRVTMRRPLRLLNAAGAGSKRASTWPGIDRSADAPPRA